MTGESALPRYSGTLPVRTPGEARIPRPRRPLRFERDTAVLARVLVGLRALDGAVESSGTYRNVSPPCTPKETPR